MVVHDKLPRSSNGSLRSALADLNLNCCSLHSKEKTRKNLQFAATFAYHCIALDPSPSMLINKIKKICINSIQEVLLLKKIKDANSKEWPNLYGVLYCSSDSNRGATSRGRSRRVWSEILWLRRKKVKNSVNKRVTPCSKINNSSLPVCLNKSGGLL